MDVVSEYHDLVRKDVLPFVPQEAGRVLDIGGGIGATSVALKDRGSASHIVLLDQVADQALPAVDASYAVDLNDLDALDELLGNAGPFDTVLCLDVLEHLVDPWGVVAIIDKHLSKGGALVVSLPNLSHWSVTVPLVFAGQFRYADKGIKDRTHLRWFSREGAVDLVGSSGLSIELVRSSIWKKAERLVNLLTLKLFQRHFTAQYFVIGRKA
ncbi:class I SAM-dependent methyltransferase [Qipengyuania aquimaris]|uniref:class I SAM-dependent methyltransferase n=1 Tax=Qipengyuania aquimaris TaxID=255984 RepID=UPI0021BD6704|nr:methyltransferase domain-containing protein [Qipengyuania aquimaris]